ncbi:hypothetical protein [Burkholderia paludis]|uniref:hypothetical protein n=1 Tax=Burkholderia paludis TaxID=1506587 RepID=UPI000A950A4C|nr:hypothetical protein [Burkholderia paludis]
MFEKVTWYVPLGLRAKTLHAGTTKSNRRGSGKRLRIPISSNMTRTIVAPLTSSEAYPDIAKKCEEFPCRG